jgi:hypothetical protein
MHARCMAPVDGAANVWCQRVRGTERDWRGKFAGAKSKSLVLSDSNVFDGAESTANRWVVVDFRNTVSIIYGPRGSQRTLPNGTFPVF